MRGITYTILGVIIGALLMYYFCPRLQQTSESFVEPNGIITVEQAEMLSDNWTKFRKPVVDSAAQKQGREQDDRSTFWNIDDIQNYIRYAKKSSDSLGYTMTGMRVYLGVYGEDADKNKKNLTTMFIVPTGHKTISKASTLNFSFQSNDNLPVPPLNKGAGGDGGYPR